MSWFFETGRKIEKINKTIRKVLKVQTRLSFEPSDNISDIKARLDHFAEEFENGCSENLVNGKFDRFVFESQSTLLDELLETTNVYRAICEQT